MRAMEGAMCGGEGGGEGLLLGRRETVNGGKRGKWDRCNRPQRVR